MKTRAHALALMSLIALAQPAAAEGATWNSLMSTAKVKVDEWVAYWKGARPVVPVPAPAAPVAPSGVTPVSPDTAAVATQAPAAPVDELPPVGHVERLTVPRAESISREDFRVPGTVLTKPAEMTALPSPAPVKLEPVRIAPAFGARTVQGNLKTVNQLITKDMVDKVTFARLDAQPVKMLPYRPLNEEQLKMVAALILFDAGGHCHLAMGLFNALAKTPATKVEATYHLGACASSLQMTQVAFDQLGQVVAAADKDFGPSALDLMVKKVDPAHEEAFFRLVTGVKSWTAMVEPKSTDLVHYRLAKGAFRAKDFKAALGFTKLVKGEYADDAKFLAAMTQFALKDKAAARQTLEELSAALDAKTNADKNLRALTAINLGRMYFAANKFQPALDQYGRVPKDHPLWVQGLIEQGWAQVATEDFSGAIGNMYSLHSPYFRAVYQPESFAVRTIGYLNICQYGDAYRTLTQLEKEYRDFQVKTAKYLENRDPASMYASARGYIQGKSTADVDGVPFQVWREVAHRRDFLNLQTSLNDQADESTRYGGVNEKIKTEKASIRAHAEAAKKHFDDYRAKIVAFGKDPARAAQRKDYEANVIRERDHVIGYRFQLTMLEQSRQGYLDFQGRATERLGQARTDVTAKAGQSLLGHAKRMNDDMTRVLDNNEFLRYEVFSGSGENIRYQVAGGQVGNVNRVPAAIKPAKMMNWNFDGEFWEDEIGSYRSGLQNNCATTVTKQANHKNDEE